ncbi:YciI family protein [Longitalea luteola]|uniref:YciI family protein n=1 Tax=Longitalea luteola TaxID=2812563 RepID=UPI001A96D710|nr:YciI family protein [Longitalea luteola]
MYEFALLFRQEDYDYSKVSPEKMKELAVKWQQWLGRIADQGKLSNSGLRFAPKGKVLRAGGIVTDGPFVDIKEMLGSFIVVSASDLEEALALAHGCPAIEENGSVEVRPLFAGNFT